jgi:hypothetical protein
LGQSEAAGAADADIEPVAPTTSARTATVNNRIIDLLVSVQPHRGLARPFRASIIGQ